MPITILKQSSALTGLQAEGPVARPLSQPASTTCAQEVELEGGGSNRSGIWECTPGRFERQLATPR